MTPEELKEIKERADKATPGPWSRNAAHVNTKWNERITSTWTFPPNAEFIAHAREDIPKLLAEVEKLTTGIYHADQQFWNQKKATDEFQRKYKNLEQENARLREALLTINGMMNSASHLDYDLRDAVHACSRTALGEGQEK